MPQTRTCQGSRGDTCPMSSGKLSGSRRPKRAAGDHGWSRRAWRSASQPDSHSAPAETANTARKTAAWAAKIVQNTST